MDLESSYDSCQISSREQMRINWCSRESSSRESDFRFTWIVCASQRSFRFDAFPCSCSGFSFVDRNSGIGMLVYAAAESNAWRGEWTLRETSTR